MRPIRWGIMATGAIAASLAEALQEVRDAQVVAVASRTQNKADQFGKKWNIPRRYASYAALAADPDVDVIYIATPHSLHYQNMLLCLNAGKHVLCEKAFTLSAPQAEDCIALARENNLFLMEAMWMRFNPAIRQVNTWLEQGLIGDVRLVQATFCIDIPYRPENRLYDPHLGGGALLDLGIYPLTFATMVLGFPDQIHGYAHLGPTGVDELDVLSLNYTGGAAASLVCSNRMERPREAFITGTQGYIKVHDIFYRPDRLTLHVAGEKARQLHIPYRGNGYAHEVEEVHACLRQGKTESDIAPLDTSLKLMTLMDEFRQMWGVVYPGEGQHSA